MKGELECRWVHVCGCLMGSGWSGIVWLLDKSVVGCVADLGGVKRSRKNVKKRLSLGVEPELGGRKS
jgi:hypothetical protein